MTTANQIEKVKVESNDGTVKPKTVAKYWEKGDKKRYYITLYFSDGNKLDLGFVDATNGEYNAPLAKGYIRNWAEKFQYAYEEAKVNA